eukprot:730939_1
MSLSSPYHVIAGTRAVTGTSTILDNTIISITSTRNHHFTSAADATNIVYGPFAYRMLMNDAKYDYIWMGRNFKCSMHPSLDITMVVQYTFLYCRPQGGGAGAFNHWLEMEFFGPAPTLPTVQPFATQTPSNAGNSIPTDPTPYPTPCPNTNKQYYLEIEQTYPTPANTEKIQIRFKQQMESSDHWFEIADILVWCKEPTTSPTTDPSKAPSKTPTTDPTPAPTQDPSPAPSLSPSLAPSNVPTSPPA